jgi:hypothetical protein
MIKYNEISLGIAFLTFLVLPILEVLIVTSCNFSYPASPKHKLAWAWHCHTQSEY